MPDDTDHRVIAEPTFAPSYRPAPTSTGYAEGVLLLEECRNDLRFLAAKVRRHEKLLRAYSYPVLARELLSQAHQLDACADIADNLLPTGKASA